MSGLLDRTGSPIAPTVTEDEAELPPTWATDLDAEVPLAYVRESDSVDRFRIGIIPRAAAVLIDREAWRKDPELLVGLAAGAWKAVVGTDCGRMMAELVAKGWIRCFKQAHQ